MDAVDLFWIPLGAGGQVVRRCGRAYEALTAWHAGRPPVPLFHTALEVHLDARRWVVEQAPVPRDDPAARGVVATGPVGVRAAGRLRIFRYEIRRWQDGVIPDVAEAVGRPQRITTDPAIARRLLALVPAVPTPVWGRDEFGTGEMWNSNAIAAWLVESAGLDALALAPPCGGRAPGWRAGVAVARRHPLPVLLP